jgi:hypothetical protein
MIGGVTSDSAVVRRVTEKLWPREVVRSRRLEASRRRHH